MNRYGEGVVVRKYKLLAEGVAVGVICDGTNHKWWRIRLHGQDIDLGIKTFSNIENIVYQDGEVYEVL